MEKYSSKNIELGSIIIRDVSKENRLNTTTKKYKVIERLGEGGFGTCYKVQDIEDNNKEYALKVISKEKFEELTGERKICLQNTLINCPIFSYKIS